MTTAPPPPPGWSTEQPPPLPPGADGEHAYAAPPAPAPGIVPLRPLRVRELLEGALRLVRGYPRATLPLAAAVMAVVAAVEVGVQWALLTGITPPHRGSTLSKAADYADRAAVAGAVSFIVGMLATLLLTGLVTAVVAEGVLGRPLSLAEAWSRLRPLLPRLFAVTGLVTLLVVGVSAAAALPGLLVLLLGPTTAGAELLGVGLLCGGLTSIWLYVSLSLAPAVVVLEKQRPVAALRRSRQLIRGSWWRALGVLVLSAVLAALAAAIISIPFGVDGGGLTALGDRTSPVRLSELVVTAVGGFVASTLTRPFTAAAVSLLYVDRRMRTENLGQALAAAAEDPNGQPPRRRSTVS
jgi:hypothetical protein